MKIFTYKMVVYFFFTFRRKPTETLRIQQQQQQQSYMALRPLYKIKSRSTCREESLPTRVYREIDFSTNFSMAKNAHTYR